MVAPGIRDPDEVQVIRGLRDDLKALQAIVVGRWGRHPYGATDPTAPANGTVWVRSDTRTTSVRIAGVTYAMQAGRVGVTADRSAAQSIATNAITAVTFPTETVDTDAMFTPGASTFTVGANFAGVWAITGIATWASAPGATAWAAINVGGVRYAVGASGNGTNAASVTIPLAAGAVVGFDVYQNSGLAINVTATLTGYRIGT